MKGINGFNTFMQASFPGAYTAVPKHSALPSPCERVYVDCNDLLHQASRRAKTEGDLFAELFTLLDGILRMCRPSRSVMLALDGPGPYAKVLEQRRRRAVNSGAAARKRKRGATAEAEKLKQALSPGTELMQRLQSALVYWAELKLTHADPRLVRGLAFYVSGSDVPGEGEVKILANVYHFSSSRAGPGGGRRSDERHVIVGGDADLLVMAIQADVPHLSVLQPDQDTRGWRLFAADRWERAVAPALGFYGGGGGGGGGGAIDVVQRERASTMRGVRLDFALLALMQGNDYLPKLAGARVAETWPRYLALRVPTGEFSAQTLAVRASTGGGGGGGGGGGADADADSDGGGGGSSGSHFANAFAALAEPAAKSWSRRSDARRSIEGFNWAFLARVLEAPDAGGDAAAGLRSPRSGGEEGGAGTARAFVAATAQRKATAYLRGVLWCLNCYRSGLCEDYSFFLDTDGVRQHAADMLRLGAAARDEIDAALRAASSAAAAEAAREGPGALRPHELLLLLLPMESRMLLPAPLRSLVVATSLAIAWDSRGTTEQVVRTTMALLLLGWPLAPSLLRMLSRFAPTKEQLASTGTRPLRYLMWLAWGALAACGARRMRRARPTPAT